MTAPATKDVTLKFSAFVTELATVFRGLVSVGMPSTGTEGVLT